MSTIESSPNYADSLQVDTEPVGVGASPQGNGATLQQAAEKQILAPANCGLVETCTEIRASGRSKFSPEFCLLRAAGLGKPCD